mmetsp:Transcript_5615/g.10028  ORF Transcript_5615/g.10028 Transcript_5615/m.10028 type:complete len:85 (+) Transcript_5615:68-322(+)|eukprot:CAMPEP_0197646400 /NCGR_PEP_ID=MMETSP1338-20131121/23129_1 /TAXON_ID=43686 ORGANISM="Pelagodinium beii, Strain RCC1491" /NCGR_SAMPLE_ID=MMETSP1338 /ASSEMBLY_ACC=CAM_ASM_000754 /LENGTH=84 /DNA_ID=CAMNT_0043220031 /DNA_START=65 /DNA_END=319 /DNA_ORIENTATION=-
MASLLRRAVVRATPLVQAQVTKPAASPAAFIRNFATTKAASPETPLMHYTSTQQATSSINHRIFYVNVVAMVLVYDLGTSLLDI